MGGIHGRRLIVREINIAYISFIILSRRRVPFVIITVFPKVSILSWSWYIHTHVYICICMYENTIDKRTRAFFITTVRVVVLTMTVFPDGTITRRETLSILRVLLLRASQTCMCVLFFFRRLVFNVDFMLCFLFLVRTAPTGHRRTYYIMTCTF